jgi:hypothetical protein
MLPFVYVHYMLMYTGICPEDAEDVLWEGHSRDPRRDRAHAHLCASPMALRRSATGVCVVLVLGVRREFLVSVVRACDCAPYGLMYVVAFSLVFPRLESSLAEVRLCFFRSFARSPSHVCNFFSLCLRLF